MEKTHTHKIDVPFFFSVYSYRREQAKERETRKYLFVLRAVCYRFRIEHIYIWKHMNPYANEFGPLPLFACHRLNSNPNKVHTHKYNMLRCTFYSFYRIECRRYFYRYICSTYGCLCLYLILTLSSILIYHTIGKGGGWVSYTKAIDSRQEGKNIGYLEWYMFWWTVDSGSRKEAHRFIRSGRSSMAR